jgi:type IV pilus assembly protein PilY1
MNIRISGKLAALVAGILIGASQPAAAAISIAQVPLFIAAGVTPNVMILFDNSGSMDNVMWNPAFDPTATVPSWAPMIDHDCNTGTALRQAWTQADGNLGLSTLISANYRGTCAGSTNTAPTCPSNHVRGRNGLVTKCLRLPDPVGGNTRYNGKYLDWLFQNYGTPTTVLLPTTTDLRGGVIIPNRTRIDVARTVATNVVTANANLRIGLTRFNPPAADAGPGGRVIADCGVTTATLTTAISGLTASTNTPLAEAYYEVTRYFRGLPSQWNAGVTYTSPIQYRCQKNFVVVITDGFPTWDSVFPNNDPADTADAGRALPNWDGLAPTTTAAMFPDFPQYSDGTLTGSAATEGFSLYLDDLAKFGYDIDLRTTGNDLTGVSYNETGKFQQQNLVTYTIGLTVNNQMMADAAQYGNGVYYQANDEDQLTKALQAAFADIEARTSSASAVATNSTRFSSETFIFQARFATSNWAGELLAFPILSDGSIGTRAWNAADEIPDAADRAIYTYDPTAGAGSRGREFEWDELNSDQQDELDQDASGDDDDLGEERLAYLRGDRSDEAPSGAGFRTRSTATVLGDIVNSDPAFVAAQDFGFDKLPGSEGGSYKAFRSAKTSREAMVYVAANDGMLHAFRADDGVERFAYIPDAVIPQLRFLTDTSFNTSHRLLNDGGPRALDAYLGGSWKTILLGSLGGGGRGIYALDVTDPDDFDTGSIMWEFTSAQDSDLGVAIPQPTIARLNNGDWAAIVANGYNSGSGEAKLFILNLATGAIIREIGTGVSGDNGLSSPIPVDVDGDRIADYVYAGDLKGNLWKFDLTATSAGSWGVAFNVSGAPAPLWTACSSDPCTTSNRQPITARPEVGINPPAGFMVYFGTGRYFAVGDNSAASGGDNTFYAIRDRNDKQTATPTRPSGLRSKLVEQELIAEIEGAEFVNDLGTAPTADDVTFVSDIRVTSRKAILDDDDGWFFDLPSTGERQVSTPILRNGRIIFTTLIPSGDACSAGGTSWLMEMDALSGGRLSFSPFDLNEDGVFDQADFVTVILGGEEVRVPTSGIRSTEGIIKTPAIITLSRDRETKKASGSSGGIFGVDENAGDQRGRMSWREVEQ